MYKEQLFLQYAKQFSEIVKNSPLSEWLALVMLWGLTNFRVSSIFLLPFRIHRSKKVTHYNWAFYTVLPRNLISRIHRDSRRCGNFFLSHACYFQNHLLLTWTITILTLVKLLERWIAINIIHFNIVNMLNFFMCHMQSCFSPTPQVLTNEYAPN